MDIASSNLRRLPQPNALVDSDPVKSHFRWQVIFYEIVSHDVIADRNASTVVGRRRQDTRLISPGILPPKLFGCVLGPQTDRSLHIIPRANMCTGCPPKRSAVSSKDIEYRKARHGWNVVRGKRLSLDDQESMPGFAPADRRRTREMDAGYVPSVCRVKKRRRPRRVNFFHQERRASQRISSQRVHRSLPNDTQTIETTATSRTAPSDSSSEDDPGELQLRQGTPQVSSPLESITQVDKGVQCSMESEMEFLTISDHTCQTQLPFNLKPSQLYSSFGLPRAAELEATPPEFQTSPPEPVEMGPGTPTTPIDIPSTSSAPSATTVNPAELAVTYNAPTKMSDSRSKHVCVDLPEDVEPMCDGFDCDALWLGNLPSPQPSWSFTSDGEDSPDQGFLNMDNTSMVTAPTTPVAATKASNTFVAPTAIMIPASPTTSTAPAWPSPPSTCPSPTPPPTPMPSPVQDTASPSTTSETGSTSESGTTSRASAAFGAPSVSTAPAKPATAWSRRHQPLPCQEFKGIQMATEPAPLLRCSDLQPWLNDDDLDFFSDGSGWRWDAELCAHSKKNTSTTPLPLSLDSTALHSDAIPLQVQQAEEAKPVQSQRTAGQKQVQQPSPLRWEISRHFVNRFASEGPPPPATAESIKNEVRQAKAGSGCGFTSTSTSGSASTSASTSASQYTCGSGSGASSAFRTGSKYRYANGFEAAAANSVTVYPRVNQWGFDQTLGTAHPWMWNHSSSS